MTMTREEIRKARIELLDRQIKMIDRTIWEIDMFFLILLLPLLAFSLVFVASVLVQWLS